MNRLICGHLRNYLKSCDPDESWTMLGGAFAGQKRTARGLLAEQQTIFFLAANSGSVSLDALDLPCYDEDGTVGIPKGAHLGPFTLPRDLPLMSKDFIV